MSSSILPAVSETWLITRVEDTREKTVHLRCSIVQGWARKEHTIDFLPLVESTLNGVICPLPMDLDVEALVVGTRRLAVYLHSCLADHRKDDLVVSVEIEGHYGDWDGAGGGV